MNEHSGWGTSNPHGTPPTIHYPFRTPTWIESCLEVLLPTQCRICLRPVRGVSMCYRCRPALPNISDMCHQSCCRCFTPLARAVADGECETCTLFPPLTDSIRFLWEYDGLARDLIRTIKYRPSISLARIAGGLLRDAAPHLFDQSDWDVIIPVPSSHATFRRRLFHPCAELARPLAHASAIPLVHGLRHDSRRAPQASLPHQERLRRLGSLFTLTKRCNPRGKRVLLIEDVITTGATISAAAALLRRSGVSRVDVLALARTRVWTRFRHRLHESLAKSEVKSNLSP
jgi:predicted amidophosphoribosyltransferase